MAQVSPPPPAGPAPSGAVWPPEPPASVLDIALWIASTEARMTSPRTMIVSRP